MLHLRYSSPTQPLSYCRQWLVCVWVCESRDLGLFKSSAEWGENPWSTLLLWHSTMQLIHHGCCCSLPGQIVLSTSSEYSLSLCRCVCVCPQILLNVRQWSLRFYITCTEMTELATARLRNTGIWFLHKQNNKNTPHTRARIHTHAHACRHTHMHTEQKQRRETKESIKRTQCWDRKTEQMRGTRKSIAHKYV